jgi:hypothetical protein
LGSGGQAVAKKKPASRHFFGGRTLNPFVLPGAVILLAATFILGGRLEIGLKTHRRRWLSLAAGVATSYVFVHLLPELSEAQQIFTRATAEKGLAFPESRVYSSALVAFVLMYGLECIVARSRERGETPHESEGKIVSWIHIGVFALYCALVTYVMTRESERGVLFLIFYYLAMSLHFLGTDHAFRREYGKWYDGCGKWVLAGGVLAGWLVASLSPLSIEVLATLMGFVGGGVVMNSMITELPKEKEGRFWPFCGGALGYGVLLLLIL